METLQKQFELYVRHHKTEKKAVLPKEDILGDFREHRKIPCGWSIIEFKPYASVADNSQFWQEELITSTAGQPLWRTKQKFRYMVKNWIGADGVRANESIDQQIARMKTCIADMPDELKAWQNRLLFDSRDEMHTVKKVADTTEIPDIMKYIITSIHGTPGSGKSTMIINLLKKLGNEYKILIVAPSHNVINNFGHRINEIKPPLDYVILSEESRLDPELMQRHVSNHRDYNPNKKNALIEATQITLSTVNKNIKNVRRAKIDIVICDEAGRVPVIDFATLIQKMSEVKSIILAGDPKQMPARIGDSETDDILRFVEKKKIGPIWSLFRQYRFGKQTNDIIAQAYYNGQMEAARKERTSRIFGIGIKGCECIDEPIGCQREAFIVHQITNLLKKTNQGDILILTPYKAQFEILGTDKCDRIQIKTIDTCQGDEASTVIISLGRHKGQGFINGNRMNVSLSRAKGLTFLIGHNKVLNACKALDKVVPEIKRLGQFYEV